MNKLMMNGMVLALIGSFPSMGWAEADTTNSIVSSMNGKCIDVPQAVIAQGKTLQTYACNETIAQHFTLVAKSGEIKIGGLCVDALSGKGNNGDSIGLWSCNGSVNQRWSTKDSQIIGINNRCMGVANDRILLMDCNSGDNQKWGGRKAAGPVAGNDSGRASTQSAPQNGVCAPVNSEKCIQARNNHYSNMNYLNNMMNQNGGMIGYNPFGH